MVKTLQMMSDELDAIITRELADIEMEIRQFEATAGMTIAEFETKWQAGALPDTYINNAAAMLIKAYRDIKAELESGMV